MKGPEDVGEGHVSCVESGREDLISLKSNQSKASWKGEHLSVVVVVVVVAEAEEQGEEVEEEKVGGRRMEHKQTILLAPALSNSSCWRAGNSEAIWTGPGFGELLRAALILVLSFGILFANLLVICVINSRRYSKYIHAQPRYLLTSLASNDLALGLLVTPFGFLPAVYGCWPYGEVVCQIQALLRGALTQQSAVILVCMAIDRYVCMLHPHRYHRHSSKKYYMRQGCVAVISTTWIASLAIFGALVLPRGGYYFNSSGLLACDPFFARASLRILACCCFYFPTTMVLMYCYGSAFHVNKLRLKRVVCVNTPEIVSGGHIERFLIVIEQKRQSMFESISNSFHWLDIGYPYVLPLPPPPSPSPPLSPIPTTTIIIILLPLPTPLG
ncbi:hypothetical protein M0802_002271 [Mischocyttarus mexicanus]|nr:hypothetical protein M0802_002271 [Mischocyttarus mexicanus]